MAWCLLQIATAMTLQGACWGLVIAIVVAASAAACTPPPAVWPIAGAGALPTDATAVDGYVGTEFNEEGVGSPRHFGAGVRHQLSEDVSVGAGASLFGVDYPRPYSQLRGYGRLQLAGDNLAAIGGLGAGSDFDGFEYGTADLALVSGIRIGVWELYTGPGVAVSAPFDGDSDATSYLGGAAGVMYRPLPRLSFGVEGVFVVILPTSSEYVDSWGGGVGLYARYLFGDLTERALD